MFLKIDTNYNDPLNYYPINSNILGLAENILFITFIYHFNKPKNVFYEYFTNTFCFNYSQMELLYKWMG